MFGRRSASTTPAAPKEAMPKGFWVLWSAVVIDMIGFGIAVPVLGPYAKSLGANGLFVGAIGSAFSAMQFLMARPLGKLSDRFGRKPVLVLSMLGTAVASVVTGLANALWVLLLARAFDGASGATIGVANAAVADLAPPRRRAALMGMMGAAFGIGFTVGPALGALASWVGGRRAPFFLAAAIAFVNAIATWIRVPETKGLATAEAADASATGAIAGLARRWNENGLRQLLLIVFLTFFAFSAFEQLVTVFMQERVGFGQRGAGITFAAVGLVLMIVQGLLVGRVVGRFGEYTVLVVGLLGVMSGFFVLAVVHHWAMLIPQVLLTAGGQGLASPSLSSSISARIDPAKRGELMGVQQSFGAAARVLGPLGGGLLYDHIDIAAPFVVGGLLYAVAVGFAVRARGAARAAGAGAGRSGAAAAPLR
jgi:MFS transporter, DHA1 family, tetracycline resistance protein